MFVKVLEKLFLLFFIYIFKYPFIVFMNFILFLVILVRQVKLIVHFLGN